MILCTLSSSDVVEFFGLPENPIRRNCVHIIGQKPDCSSFLLLAPYATSPLVAQTAIPDGYDFTYRQSWGLVINEDVLSRVFQDLRAAHYPAIGDQLDAIWKGGTDADEMRASVRKVKSDYPKPAF